MTTASDTRPDLDFCTELAQQLRVDSVVMSDRAGSGHPTSSMSAADLVAVLLGRHLRWDLQAPDDPHNDHLIFSKGHASPLYYAMLHAAGAIDEPELRTYRRLDSRLEGHPTPRMSPTDVATGSLGQGLPIGVGIALAAKELDKLPYRVWVLCGDSEMAEGSMWEAFQYAGWRGLDNLTAIIDVNRLGQTRETMLGHDLDAYAARVSAFGWHPVVVDGHDVAAIDRAYTEAQHTSGRPCAIIARTLKGRGVAAVEDKLGKHGKPLDDATAAVAELGGFRDLRVEVQRPDLGAELHRFTATGGTRPTWEVGTEGSTREAYGAALAWLGATREDVVALDGEVSNSTHSDEFASAEPDRYFEMFIAEQQMVAATVGLGVRGWTPFASTFGAFWARAYDFVRMAAVSRADLRLCGSHAGVAIGADGPSQMALEDLASMRAIHGSAVLHPSDANQVVPLMEEMADRGGITYLRVLRGTTTVRTPADERVHIGGSRTVRHDQDDEVTVLACGVTVDEAVDAADLLAAQGIGMRVVDCYSVKPLDADTVRRAAAETDALITVEDHRPEGGLGDAVLEALAAEPVRPQVHKLAVDVMPTSGTPEELMKAAGIDAEAIVALVHRVRTASEAHL
ncbi:transketolase [Flexivirga oryzae]|uniref:Transketolase n=1 Tax=Flexivirga oryzae TaxID=1794944 RepID=A0A839N2E3_9MICO|nr:transketolase [Flexivirga oryzae]MBB2891507.1 transketolase [Flexivirga oryzae]